MPDITKCTNEECSLREICYRFTSDASEMQSYANFEPDEDGNCQLLLENMNGFPCKKCRNIVIPPQIPICEIAAAYGAPLRLNVTFTCGQCGKEFYRAVDSEVYCRRDGERDKVQSVGR